MKNLSACALLTAWLVSAGATPPATVPDPISPKPIRPSKIILLGDSTTAVQGGWGGSFCAEHVTSSVACLNFARFGRRFDQELQVQRK
jgi:hypothetical protein